MKIVYWKIDKNNEEQSRKELALYIDRLKEDGEIVEGLKEEGNKVTITLK